MSEEGQQCLVSHLIAISSRPSNSFSDSSNELGSEKLLLFAFFPQS